MNPNDLYEAYQNNKDRPAWIRRHRDELQAAVDVDLDEPIPQDLGGFEDWLPRYKSVLTRELKPDSTDADSNVDAADRGDDQ